jgi:hypothetical protein
MAHHAADDPAMSLPPPAASNANAVIAHYRHPSSFQRFIARSQCV